MPRVGKCPCGATLRVPDNPPPEGVKCAACGRVLKVRPRTGTAAPASPAGAPPQSPAAPAATCPNCQQAIEPGAILCLHCGLNLAEGRVVDTRIEKAEAKTGFLHELKDEFLRQLKKWWWVFVGLGLLGYFLWWKR